MRVNPRDEAGEYCARAYAGVLAGYYANSDSDVLSCGKQSRDTDAGLTGPRLAPCSTGLSAS